MVWIKIIKRWKIPKFFKNWSFIFQLNKFNTCMSYGLDPKLWGWELKNISINILW